MHITTIGDVCSKNISTVSVDQPLSKALQLMQTYDYSQLPVLDNGQYVGSIRERMLSEFLVQGVQSDTPLSSCPLEEAFTQREATNTLAEALAWFDDSTGAVLVTASQQVVGILTPWDLMHYSRPYILLQEMERMTRKFTWGKLQQQYGPNWFRQPNFLNRGDPIVRKLTDTSEQANPTGEELLNTAGFKECHDLLKITKWQASTDKKRCFDLLHEVRGYRNRIFHIQEVGDEDIGRLHQILDDLKTLYANT